MKVRQVNCPRGLFEDRLGGRLSGFLVQSEMSNRAENGKWLDEFEKGWKWRTARQVGKSN